MASQATNKTSSLLRYRPVIIAVLAIAAGCTGYYLHTSLSASSTPSKSRNVRNGRLHRSNAVRRPRQPRPLESQGATTTQENSFPVSPTTITSPFHYGDFVVTSSQGTKIEVPLVNSDLPTAAGIAVQNAVGFTEAVQIRQDLEVAFLNAFLARAMPVGPVLQLSSGDRQSFVNLLGLNNNIGPENTQAALERYCQGELENHPNRIERRMHEDEERQRFEQHSRPQNEDPAADRQSSTAEASAASTIAEEELHPSIEIPETSSIESPDTNHLPLNINPVDPNDGLQRSRSPAETVMERSQHSWREEADHRGEHKKQTVLSLIYHIAEEQSKKEGYIHRGVTCNGCSALPIRGIRYRCTNCADFDLCELCESQQIHDRTHLFYKVRIPAPFLGNPRQPQPVWYPGKPRSDETTLNREDRFMLCQSTGLEGPTLEALWEQFKCLAAADYPDDPTKYFLAIDRPTFDKCFVPKSSTRPPPPNLIYERMFAFYDNNADGLIGFREFVVGVWYIAYKKPEERLRQIYNGYDIDNDGFTSRVDFQRMFKALFNLHKELAKDIVTRLDDEVYDEEIAREVINSSQALSSAFPGSIPPGDPSQTGEGKARNAFGDYVITNNSTENVDYVNDWPIEWPHQQDYGQEILHQVIHESINELLDPLFRFREDIGLEVYVTEAERQQHHQNLMVIRRAGFWIILEVLINRFEQKWRNKSGNALVENEAKLLVEYITGNHLFRAYNPSNEYYEKRKQQAIERYRPYLAAGLVAEGSIEPPLTIAETHTHKYLLAELRRKLQERSPLRGQAKAKFEVFEDFTESSDSCGWTDALQELTSPPVPPSLDVKEALIKIQADDIPPVASDSKEQPPVSAKTDSHPDSIPSASESSDTSVEKLASNLYEFSTAERPIDPMMPQNRPNAHADGQIATPSPPPTMERLKYLSLMDLLAHRDRGRGGPGRISWLEFESIMRGPKGLELGFVGSWIEMATF